MWGFFKKIVIADRLAIYVNTVYADVTAYTGTVLLIATFFFAIQIYCDFSGYTDIAIGLAKILGFNFMDNFRRPYFATSIRDFWRRWHISLSTWFRDYVYIPLGGNRVSFARNLINLMIVFLLSGLWHGTNWTFVIWGALHGLYIVVETLISRRSLKSPPKWLNNPLKWGITFVLVLIAWTFFRAQSLDDAVYVLAHMFDLSEGVFSRASVGFSSADGVVPVLQLFGPNISGALLQLALSFGLIALLFTWDFVDGRYGVDNVLNRTPRLMRYLYYYALLFSLLLLGAWGSQQFIYFQF